ncbi:MAG: TetR/AcrR family transcriptional regulator [Candidatus Marinimicrobia bacterium]|nr:TetR/AcrR family transcriptional regulator [Candidatus Neomarinimicrobiota bacterium]
MSGRVNKKAKHDRIIQAGLKVFARDGYPKAKIIDIAESAGIGKGTVYEYFSSKKELFLNVFSYVKELILSKQWEVLDEGLKPLDSLKKIAKTNADIYTEQSMKMRFLAQFRAECIRGDTDGEFSRSLNEYHEEIIALISRYVSIGIEEGLIRPTDVDMVSENYHTALDGLGVQYLLNNEEMDLNSAVISLYEIFIKGIGTFNGRYADLSEDT